jgi:hypothetical protein
VRPPLFSFFNLDMYFAAPAGLVEPFPALLAARFVRIKNHGDFHHSFRTAGRELPLQYRFLRAFHQNGIAADHFRVSDRAIGLHKHPQPNDPANPFGLKYRGVRHRCLLKHFAGIIVLRISSRCAKECNRAQAERSEGALISLRSGHVFPLRIRMVRGLEWEHPRIAQLYPLIRCMYLPIASAL